MATKALILVYVVPAFLLSGLRPCVGVLQPCDFETDFCGFTHDNTDDFNWARKQGPTDTSNTGPNSDHTHGNSQGSYVYAESSSPQSNGDQARLMSPPTDAATTSCVSFYYYMSGSQMGSLRVYSRESGAASLGVPVFERSGNRGQGWYRGLATMEQNTVNIQLVFEAVIGDGELSDIAIDDIDVPISDGPCPESFINCTFESDLCSFEQDSTDDFDYTRRKGATPSFRTGPEVDHTLGTEEGFYVFIEASNNDRGDRARLISPWFRGRQEDDAETFCVVFWYHMYGNSIGQLNVYLRNVSSADMGTPIWALSGGRGPAWRAGEAVLDTPEDFQVIFESSKGSSIDGDIALDDILITSYGCPGLHIIRNESSVSCDFGEIELCYYEQDDSDDFDWEWTNRATDDDFTGPDFDHTRGDQIGFFLFIESSFWNGETSKARIMSPVTTAAVSASSCVEFWYHMWGRDVNKLNVYVKREQAALPSTPTVQITGDHGNYWHRQAFNVDHGIGDYRIVFEGYPGEDDRDDIALDDVTLYQGQDCPAFVTDPLPTTTPPPPVDNIDCDFEDGWCDYTQDTWSDQGDWSRYRGGEGPSSFSTGPDTDHTTGTVDGYFASFDPYDLTGTNLGDAAILMSPYVVAVNRPRCLKLYAYMYGSSVDYFNIFVRPAGTTRSLDPQYSLYGNQGKQWLEIRVDLASSNNMFQILFEAMVGFSKYAAEIAIDDITIENGACIRPPTDAPAPWSADCDFESEDDPMCGYYNRNYNSLDWMRHTGTTGSDNTGPTTDHTLGTPGGHYMYMETSQPARPNRYGALFSPILNSGGQDLCIRFYYHAYGKDIGRLEVEIDMVDRYSTSIQFRIVGDQGNQWHPGNVAIPGSFTNSEDFQVNFEARKTESGSEGDIAIDDILFLRQPCEGFPGETDCSFEQGVAFCSFSHGEGRQRWAWYDLLGTEPPPLNAASSSFMYATVSTPSPLQSALLYSGMYDMRGMPHCLTLDLILSGDDDQRFKVDVQEQSSQLTSPVGQLTGDLGGSWVRANWTVTSTQTKMPFQFVFTATFGSSIKGMIAMDNIMFSEHMGACEQYVPPPTNRPTTKRPTTRRTTKTSMTPSPSTASRSPITEPLSTSQTPDGLGGSPAGMIVGIVFGVIVAVVATFLVVVFVCRPSCFANSNILSMSSHKDKMDEKPFSTTIEEVGHGAGPTLNTPDASFAMPPMSHSSKA